MKPPFTTVCAGLVLCAAAGMTMAAQKLNNFVTELVDVASPKQGESVVELDRSGWLLLRVQTGEEVSVTLDSKPLPLQPVTINGGVTWLESMQQATAGKHTVALNSKVNHLQVRRVPEIRYCRFQYDPWVYKYGPYDWAFLEKYVLAHVNTIVGGPQEDQRRYAVPWRERGGRWITEGRAPGLHDENIPSADPETARKAIIDAGSLEVPWVDVALLDEYYPTVKPGMFPVALAGLKAIREDPQFKHKSVEPYVANNPREMADFLRDAARLTDRMFVEMYNGERETEEKAHAYLTERIVKKLNEYRSCVDEDRKQVFGIALGQMSGPPESLNGLPQANYRVFQDMEFQLLATSPEVEQLDALFEYTAGYAEEETIRWVARLYRHYCIEGKTERLSDEPYVPGHLENPDFANGTNGWKVEAATDGSVRVEHHESFGSYQGRYATEKGIGDHFLVMTRHETKPNVIRQSIKNLRPGKLYVLRLYSTGLDHRQSSYGNPVLNDVTRPGITINGVEMLPEKSFDHLFRSIHTPKVLFFGYHLRLFRATDQPAELTLSDWQSPTERGGNPDRPTAINFVEIQPYLEWE